MKNNWQMTTLGDVFDIKSSKRVHKSDWKNEGIPFYRAREIVKLSQNGCVNNDLFISKELFNKLSKTNGYPQQGDLVVSAVGTLGLCYVVKEFDRFYFKDASVLWLSKKTSVISEYIKHLFQSDLVLKQVAHKSMGATVGTLTIDRAKRIKIPLPPLLEQQRFVKILDSSFAKIDKSKLNIEKNLQNSKKLFESYLQNIFINKGKNWEEKTLGKICEKITDGSHNPPKGISESNYLMLSSKNIFNDKINYKNPRFLSEQDYLSENKRTQVKSGDILLTIVGTIGRTAVVPEKHLEFTLQRSVAVLKNNKDLIESRFLMFVLQSKLAFLTKESRGVAQKGLYLNQIKNISVSFPKSLSEQRKIVSHLDSLSSQTKKLESIYQQKLANLEELKKSILAKAFAGEL